MAETNTSEGKPSCPAGDCPAEANGGITRRRFLSFAGWGAFITSLGALLFATGRFLFPRVIFEPPTTFKIGVPEDFNSNESPDKHNVIFVDERWKHKERVWIVRETDRLYAMFTRCTHLGCTPNWFPEDNIFKCPCHGSQYYSNGKNFAGPAPRPLDRFNIAVADDGKIVVDKSVMYDFKRFDEPGAYLSV